MTIDLPARAGTDLGLTGKVAFVSGASRGLGRAIAGSLCGAGCHVVLGYASATDAAERTVTELAGLPGTATAVRADLREPDALAAVLDRVEAEHGRLDVFVHNAATFTPMLALAVDAEAFYAEQRLAVGPLVHGASRLARMMQDEGRIVVVSGNGAGAVVPGYVATGVAKAALESMVRYLAVEFGPLGITVNAVSTGLLDKGPDTSNPHVAGFLASRTPNGRLTVPEDVAAVVTLLCSAQARWVQGQVITVDGGLGLHA